MYKNLLGELGEYKKPAIVTIIAVFFESLIEVIIPYMVSKIMAADTSNGINEVVKLGAIIISLALLSLVFGIIAGRGVAISSSGFGANIRKKVFGKIQDFSFKNIDSFSTPSLIIRLTTDVNFAQMAFMMSNRILFRAPVMLIFATIMAFAINAKMAIIFVFAIPVLAASFLLLAKFAMPLFLKMLKKFDDMDASIQEDLIAIRVVKAFVRGKHESNKFSFTADEVRAAQVKAEKLLIFASPIMQFVMYGCIIAIVWFGSNQIINTATVSQGAEAYAWLTSFMIYVMQILMSLMMLAAVFIMTVMSRASVERINEVLTEKIDIKDDDANPENTVESGAISFRNVSFSYKKEGNLSLENVNLEIKPGESVGIIGGTGSAKTTLVQLIPRLYDVTEGEILVGNKNVKDYKIKTLREAVAMVLQKNLLFSGTIRENLKWGDTEASEEEIENALKNAQAYDFVMDFPKGLETDLGQGGVNVSGGQKQRLCIARALLKKPRIIILDDSTSAVDTDTDRKIRASFKRELKDTTTIIIAQRIASVMDADKIIVLDDGKINGIGTHEEMLQNNQIYKEVYQSQQVTL